MEIARSMAMAARGLAWLGFAVLADGARAAVAAGENLLINGTFEAEQVEFPEFWSPSDSKNVFFQRTGGPEGKTAAVVLKAEEAAACDANVRQQGLTLVSGGVYTLSARIRTKGFKSRNAGLIVHNSGWLNDTGIKTLPSDSEWTFVEKTFKLFPSKGNEYGVALFAQGMNGEIAVADVRLAAVSEDALKGSSSQMALVKLPRLVPVRPLLNRIPLSRPELTFKFYGVLPEKPGAYECVAEMDGGTIPRQSLPLEADGVRVPLAGLPCGDHALRTTVRHRETRAAVLERLWPVSVVAPPAVDIGAARPLNNLVSELLDQPVKAGAAAQTFTFGQPRDGWIFVSLTTAAALPELKVTLDGADTVIAADADWREAFREVARGVHRITVSGAAADARLRVHAIPEIFNYPPCVDSFVKENGAYDWAFMKRYVLHAVTTLNGGALPGDALPEAKARGLKWLANFNVAPVDDPDDVRARMEKHAGMVQPQYDGFTSDELFFNRVTIDTYTKALWALRNPENRLIYTWIVGKPGIAALHTDFMSACLNASKGRGRLLFEAYCHPQADERAAAAYLDNMIGETMRRFNAFFPGAAAGTGIIFGNFNQIPILSLEHDPAVDFKYFLDMQVNLVANSPDFRDLATVGYWGTYYGDEELARWSFLLMRHYAVEGNREMLSGRYGFTYVPGFVANGDFADGLNGWTVSPAAESSVRADALAGYGKNSQGRWGAGKAGDTFCVMTRQPAAVNRVSQTARGLTVGKAYCLQFVTADRRDLLGKTYNPRRYGIGVELEGAERVEAKSFVHVDRRKGGRYAHNDNVAKVNLHRIVFRAASPSLSMAFNDAAAEPGEELMLNYVQLKPYLE
jgi:hypothetical protein